MDFINNYILTIGNFGYWIIFAITLLESLAFVGNLIPGSTLTVFAGVLCAQGYFDFKILVLFTMFGAMFGDFISYWLGTKGTKFFQNENKYLKRSHLESGENFFIKHGRKSVFLGRFIGPLRCIIPFIAGLSKMDKWIFVFWNITSAILWSFTYLSLGYFFGGFLKTIEGWFSKIGIITVIVLVSVIIKYKKQIFKYLNF